MRWPRASRFHPSAIVTLIGQIVSLVLIVVAVAVAGTPMPGLPTFAWGWLAGAAGAVGLACLYYAFANGAMTVVAPISAVVGAVLPVTVGLALGERPAVIAYVGIAFAIVSVALVSGAVGHHDRPTPRRIMGFAVVAGLRVRGAVRRPRSHRQRRRDCGRWSPHARRRCRCSSSSRS